MKFFKRTAGAPYTLALLFILLANTLVSSAVHVFAQSIDQKIVSFSLINADTDQPISGYDPMPQYATINLALLQTRNLNIRANTSPAIVGSVRFGLNGNTNYRIESSPPYSLGGDNGGDYSAWTYQLGSYNVSATPYTYANAGGQEGTTSSLNFTITDSTQVASGAGAVSGELRKWHRVAVIFNGPSTDETAGNNPFLNYRLVVSFTSPTGKTKKVPGHFAADSNAADTAASSGNKWRVYFTPDEEGAWNYAASFRTGTNINVTVDPNAGTPTSFDGETGSFFIEPTNKVGRDHRSKGLLRYVGGHHLRFEGSGEYFLKGGADSPENFLAYNEFDQTPAKHYYGPHAGDWRQGDPTWQGGKGKNIAGALNYLSGKGMNSVYFLTMNVGGDGNDVWPWTSDSERDRFDISKLDQWEIVFSHMDRLGLMLHVVTQETENELLLDGGALGVQRKLYYKEMISRFGHHLALVWNLGEENGTDVTGSGNTDQQRKDFSTYIRSLDVYEHPIVGHTHPDSADTIYWPLLGWESFEGPSLQLHDISDTHAETIKWVDRSAQYGRKWVVSLDEVGPANLGVLPDAVDAEHDAVRKQGLWGNLMAGGAGVEWYFGYSYAHNDLNCEDWRSRERMWEQTHHALEFFRQYVPFVEMRHADELTSSGENYCLAKGGEVYAVYLPNGGTTSLNLESSTDTYTVAWYNPRTGGALEQGSVPQVSGPGFVSIGAPPRDMGSDWVAQVKRNVNSTQPTPTPTPIPSPAEGEYLSDLPVTAVANGWGPIERDMSNGEQATGDGRTITLGGKTYAKGLGVHSDSDVRVSLGGTYQTFISDVGVDDEVGANGTVTFQVWADKVKLYDSGLLTGTSATRMVSVDVTGRQELQLVVTTGGDGYAFDHADWAGARLVHSSSPTPTPEPAPLPTPSGYYQLVARHSGKCLDVSRASTADLASVIQWDCNTGANQQWQFESVGDGYYRIMARHSGKTLEVKDARLDDLAPVVQYGSHTGANQHWKLEPLGGDGYYRIAARHSGKALDIKGESLENGADAVQYTPHTGANQRWLLRSAPM